MRSTIRRAYLTGCVLPLLLVALAAAAPRPAPARRVPTTRNRPATISIDNFTFKARTITVAAGTSVTWVNHDDVPHKIVTSDKKISSPVLDTDGKFSYTFTTPGTYEYYCSIHPTMTGTVIVK